MGRFVIFVFAFAFVAQFADAAPKLVLQSQDWQVFQDSVDGTKVCYATTEAEDLQPKTARHGRVIFFVSNWQGGTKNQPSGIVGYDFRSNSTPKLSIGGKTWSLYPSENQAFSVDVDDKNIVNALKRGNDFRLTGVSARGTQVAYSFSLAGSSRAISRAAEICS